MRRDLSRTHLQTLQIYPILQWRISKSSNFFFSLNRENGHFGSHIHVLFPKIVNNTDSPGSKAILF